MTNIKIKTLDDFIQEDQKFLLIKEALDKKSLYMAILYLDQDDVDYPEQVIACTEYAMRKGKNNENA